MKMPFNHSLWLYPTLLFFSLILYSACPPVENNHVSIQKLIEDGKLTVDILGKGGHSGECVTMNLKNNVSTQLKVKIESGRRLFSKNEKEQDILIVKPQILALAPNEQKDIDVFGFCCQSHNSSPDEGSGFSIGEMSTPELVKAAEYMSKGEYPTHAMQRAVWVISDGHDITSVHDGDTARVFDLRKFLCEMTGQEMQWYSSVYRQNEGELFSGEIVRIHGDFKYTVTHNSLVTIKVHNRYGRLVHTVLNKVYRKTGTHMQPFDVNVEHWKKGNYTVTITGGSELLSKKIVTI